MIGSIRKHRSAHWPHDPWPTCLRSANRFFQEFYRNDGPLLPPRGRGVDIAFEAGWAEELVQETADTVCPGGRIILVGIPADDRCRLKHSTARRKGLTFLFSRRMKHTYPGAIELVEKGRVNVQSLITHRFPLQKAPEAFAMNAQYEQEVVKVMIHVG